MTLPLVRDGRPRALGDAELEVVIGTTAAILAEGVSA
jgi:hypothetical protein